MSLGPVMVDLEGLALTERERRLLAAPAVGGVILFARNYADPEQLRALVHAIHELRHPRLLVAVDQEGGPVQRFRDDFTRLPPVAQLGAIHDHNPTQARRLARITGWLMAAELRALGVDISFAPVLDLNHGVSTVIGERALHRDAEVVAGLAHAYQQGMHEAGMQAVGKHFPGHGAVVADSHHELPVDRRSLADIELDDLVAFERMVNHGIAGLMTAHVVYPAVDERAATFSRFWIGEVLRRRLGFQGAVFSDDLSMRAAAVMGDAPARARRALEAGCDMVLVCNAPAEAEAVVAALGPGDPASHMRLTRLHGRPAAEREALHASERWQRAAAVVHSYDDAPLLDMDL